MSASPPVTQKLSDELLALSTLSTITAGMVRARLSRDALAATIEVSRAQIDKWFADPLSLKLPQLADILWACGLEVHGLTLAEVPKEEPANAV